MIMPATKTLKLQMLTSDLNYKFVEVLALRDGKRCGRRTHVSISKSVKSI